MLDKKKLTPKEIFRTLAFHYHFDEKIPLDMLCDMVSSVYYPKDPKGDAKKRYQVLLVALMKQHTNGEKYITEEEFIDFMNEMQKNKKEEYTNKLARRIFNRYAQVDKDTGEEVICEQGFQKMGVLFKIHEDDAMEYFQTVADRKNQINFQRFKEYMNAMVPQY